MLEKELVVLRDFKESTEKKKDNIDEHGVVDKDDTNEVDAINIDEREKIVQNRKDKKKRQKAKKDAEKVRTPTTGQTILFKESDREGWKTGRVVASWKKNSIHKYWKHLQLDGDVIVEKDFENGILEWKDKTEETEDNDETMFLDTDPDGVFPVQLVPTKEYDTPEVQAAIEREISKYKSFDAFKEVDDVGQKMGCDRAKELWKK